MFLNSPSHDQYDRLGYFFRQEKVENLSPTKVLAKPQQRLPAEGKCGSKFGSSVPLL
jgi:hypothetical protein